MKKIFNAIKNYKYKFITCLGVLIVSATLNNYIDNDVIYYTMLTSGVICLGLGVYYTVGAFRNAIKDK